MTAARSPVRNVGDLPAQVGLGDPAEHATPEVAVLAGLVARDVEQMAHRAGREGGPSPVHIQAPHIAGN